MEFFVHPARPLRLQEHRVRVQRAQHPVDRSLDELRVVGRLDVVVLHQVEHLGEEVQLAAQVVRGEQSAGHAEAEQQGQAHGHREGA